jgi:hypothetical protein
VVIRKVVYADEAAVVPLRQPVRWVIVRQLGNPPTQPPGADPPG